MTTKKYAIPEHVANIALDYAPSDKPTVSKGIQKMSEIIKAYEKEVLHD